MLMLALHVVSHIGNIFEFYSSLFTTASTPYCWLNFSQCTMHNAHCTHFILCTLCTHCTLCTLHTANYSLPTAHCTLNTKHYTWYNEEQPSPQGLWTEKVKCGSEMGHGLHYQTHPHTLHCTALHCTALHCTALHCTALHCTALFRMLQCTMYLALHSCSLKLCSGTIDLKT